MNTNPERMCGLNEQSENVIQLFFDILNDDDFIEKYEYKVTLEEGDFLLVNNWKVLRRRNSFEIDPDNWRWLMRVYFEDVLVPN